MGKLLSRKFPLPLGFANQIRGFSLVELLVVIAILLILAGLSTPVLVGISRSRSLDAGLLSLTGILDQARQQAIARNTFVWVAFSEGLPGRNPGAGVVVIASRGGVDSLQWNTNPVSLPDSGDLEMIERARELTGLNLLDSGQVSLPGLPAATGANPRSLEPVGLEIFVGGAIVKFNRAVQFTPTGEARVRSFSPVVEIGVRPTHQGDASNSAVIRLAGLTGKSHVYRPQ